MRSLNKIINEIKIQKKINIFQTPKIFVKGVYKSLSTMKSDLVLFRTKIFVVTNSEEEF